MAENHWDVPGKAASEATTREPGDLPSETLSIRMPGGFSGQGAWFWIATAVSRQTVRTFRSSPTRWPA
ncbi:hypothetical protein MPLSOD_210059 [Mesorhizobium sp. SOD10]|nr:hypothetical protein MPLSOD_210059 [Mesorhizobium sp. SOD10]